MKGLSSLERVILETVSGKELTFFQIHEASGLHENVCFNLLQALVIRGLLKVNGLKYSVAKEIPPLILLEVNSEEARLGESFELIEAIAEQTEPQKVFKLHKVALDHRDEAIFKAMLFNLESFLRDAHKKSQNDVQMKDRKIVFWGMGNMANTINHMVKEG